MVSKLDDQVNIRGLEDYKMPLPEEEFHLETSSEEDDDDDKMVSLLMPLLNLILQVLSVIQTTKTVNIPGIGYEDVLKDMDGPTKNAFI